MILLVLETSCAAGFETAVCGPVAVGGACSIGIPGLRNESTMAPRVLYLEPPNALGEAQWTLSHLFRLEFLCFQSHLECTHEVFFF